MGMGQGAGMGVGSIAGFRNAYGSPVKGRTNQSILRPKLQRRLRNNMTDAEKRLWRFLRQKQMSNFKFRRQHPFGDYIIDFVCLEVMLAVEVDGGQHNAQRV